MTRTRDALVARMRALLPARPGEGARLLPLLLLPAPRPRLPIKSSTAALGWRECMRLPPPPPPVSGLPCGDPDGDAVVSPPTRAFGALGDAAMPPPPPPPACPSKMSLLSWCAFLAVTFVSKVAEALPCVKCIGAGLGK
jgi:hypothetical protein